MNCRILVLLALAGSAAVAASDTRVPVIVELFTSEGCSSCPAADGVLARLQRMQPVSNAHIIAVEEHVDYWNNLGWVDQFSSPQFRARQNDYAQAFGVESVYTPQMVVNGLVQFEGTDIDRASTEIRRLAAQPSATVRLQTAKNPKGAELVDLVVHIRDVPQIKVPQKGSVAPLDVYLAVTEDDLHSDVARGENSGRRLRHAAVVRSFGIIGGMDPRDGTELGLRPTLKLPSAWKRPDLHAVIFLQEHITRRILGAETIDLN